MLELVLLCSLCLPHRPDSADIAEFKPKQHIYHLDKNVLYLAGLQTGMLVMDGIATERRLQRPVYSPGDNAWLAVQETNPVSRALLGPYPTWKRMVPLGAAEVISSAYLAQYFKRRHGRLWWVPQVSLSVVHGVTGSLNIPVAFSKMPVSDPHQFGK
jgi:hypothetical protein